MHTFWRLIFYNIVDTTYDLLYNVNNSQDLFLLLCHNTTIMRNGFDVSAWNMHQELFSYGTITLLKEELVACCGMLNTKSSMVMRHPVIVS